MQARDRNEIIPYDPALVSLCGNVASTLLFCYYEHVHGCAGYPRSGVSKPSLEAWRAGLGYGRNRQPWYRHHYRIGVIHYGSSQYRAAVRAGREFLSDRMNRYLFFALELVSLEGPAILHRNATLINLELARIRGAPIREPVSEPGGSWTWARDDAAQMIERLEKAIHQH